MSNSEQPTCCNNISICLIEDCAGDQKLVESSLASGKGGMDYQIITAGTLSEGMDILSKEPIDVVLLDLHLPDSQGYETFSQLFEKFPQVPIIVLSSKGSEELAIATVAHGAQDYLSKELVLDSYWLFRTIRYAIGRAQLRNELNKAKQEAENLTKLKAEFVATMSHEIRTPINGVIGMTSLLLRSNLSPEQREKIEVIKFSGEALLAIINDILDMSKAEAGKIELEEQDFSLESLLHQTIKLFHSEASQKSVELLIEVDSNLPPVVYADPARLRQVLFNLIGNAVKFTHQGAVKVLVKKVLVGNSPFVRIEVKDSGIGIPPEASEKLFSPFSQADSSMARKYGGTGLGLAISKRLVALLKGGIGFSSIIGKGSVFWITLPLIEGRTVVVPEGKARDISSNIKSADLPPPASRREDWILVAEDNPINQKIAASMVRELGYNVDAVASGEEAIRAIQRNRYSAILMDCQMPHIDGFEATRRIRDLKGDMSTIPIIALTANAMAGDREKCIASQMNDYLAKPILLETLEEKLRLWVCPRMESRSPIIDTQILQNLKKLDSSQPACFINEIIDMFIELTPPLLSDLRNSWESGKTERVGKLAHKLRGSSANLGAHSMERICALLEKQNGKGGYSPNPTLSLIIQLETEYYAVKEVLERDWRVSG